jgi:FSR family fosmidomycin resistance protein-like MFS transporter
LLLGYSFLGPNLNVYLARDLGYGKTAIGLISLAGTGIATLFQPLLGYVIDRWSRRLVMLFGCVSLSLGHLVLLRGGQISWIVLSQILIQCHNAFFMATAAHVTDTVAFGQKSRALSIVDSIGNVARAVAATAGGFLIAATNVQTALKIAAIFPVVTIFIVVLGLRNLRPPSVDQGK